jgi:uncharacterized integral membrane protein (TIGR00698 family)
MNITQASKLPTIPPFHPTSKHPNHLIKVIAMILMATCLVLWASPPTALVTGILFTLLIGHPFEHWNHRVTKYLLQTCVVLLGFGMNLPVVLHLGVSGSLFAAITIGMTLLLGYWLGQRLALNRNISMLIAVGTAICGGSAIAAVSSVIAATEAEIAVSIGTIFLLNALALYIFPIVGHLMHLSQQSFGLWSGIAIHDISSVVGAGLSYGPEALITATAVKLSRTLWIVPVTLGIALSFGKGRKSEASGNDPHKTWRHKVAIPWFIGFFLLASLLRSYVPSIELISPQILDIARYGMILVLFLIGSALSLRALRLLGWRTILMGVTLWLFISITSLLAILFFSLAPS